MKSKPLIGSTVRIVCNEPAKGQDSITHLIGKEYEVLGRDDEDGSVSVHDEEMGQIVLQRKEFECVG